MEFLDQVKLWINLYGYYIIFPLAVVEGPIVAVISGWLVSQGLLDKFPTFSILLLGDFTADTVYYCIGRFGGRPIMNWSKKILKKQEGHLVKLENHFKNHGVKTVYFGKTQAYSAAVLAAAGAAKMPFTKYFFVSISGGGILITILLLTGYFFGKSYREINNFFYIAGFLSFALLAVIAFVIMRRKNIKP